MKNISAALAIFVFSIISAHAQLVSFQLQESFTKAQLDSLLTNTGFSSPIPPSYDVDIYIIIYKTPYKHVDSLVNTSGIVAVPKGTSCSLPLGCYAHGTMSSYEEAGSSFTGRERPIGLLFAGIGGTLTVLPDELGLSPYDSVLVHPYMNAFHSGYASVNGMRAGRELADTLALQLNGEVILTGYSQGGYTTMATLKLIEAHFPNEFNVVGCAPMSGAYDLNVTMADLMLSPNPYSAPAYLPFILLGYHSVYSALQQLYPNAADLLKSPYDTLLPPIFYAKQTGIGTINGMCPAVPITMMRDSAVAAFVNDSQHPLRTILAENDLLGWAPQAPVKIHYCRGDDQVSYLNAVRADSSWRANGAPNIQIQDFGNVTHAECVQPAISSAAFYLLTKLTPCSNTGIDDAQLIAFRFFPNPASGQITVIKQEGIFELRVFSASGQQVYTQPLTGTTAQLDFNFLQSGFYIAELRDASGISARRNLILE